MTNKTEDVKGFALALYPHLHGDAAISALANECAALLEKEPMFVPSTRARRAEREREALQARVAELEEMLSGLLKTFEGVGFRIGKTHPPRTASYEEAEQHYATNYQGETALFMYQQWCQWRLVCMARAALEGKKDE